MMAAEGEVGAGRQRGQWLRAGELAVMSQVGCGSLPHLVHADRRHTMLCTRAAITHLQAKCSPSAERQKEAPKVRKKKAKACKRPGQEVRGRRDAVRGL